MEYSYASTVSSSSCQDADIELQTQLAKRPKHTSITLNHLYWQTPHKMSKDSEFCMSISYGVMFWYTSSVSHSSRAFITQKRMIRAIMGMQYHQTCRGVFKKLGILTVPCLYIFNCASFTKNNLELFAIHGFYSNNNTRGRNDLSIPAHCTGLFDTGPLMTCIRVYNALPALKTFLQKKEFYSLHDLYEAEEMVDDPYCNPNKPVRVTFEEITSAVYKIRSGIKNTPCIKSHMSVLTEMDIYLKKDFLQHTGSFKDRGARYALLMLNPEERKKGAIAASLGNHAQAICYHGHELGIPITVVMPLIAPIMKIQKCREYNATVIMEGKDMAEAKKKAVQLSKEKGLTYINGYDHPHIIAGQGTIGLEIIEQVPDIDAIVVPTGGGGLLAGVSVAVKMLNPKIQIIGVESERCASYSNAMAHNRPMFTPIEGTLADGLAVPETGYNAWETSKNLIDKLVVVKEEWIALAILRFIENEKCVVEGAAACGLAAILAGQLNEFRGKRIVLILSGGNIDTTILGRCLERGLAADGRLVKCRVTVSDRPGGICELCKLFVSIGVSIKDVIHERAWVTSDVFSVEVIAVCETRDYAHSIELKDLLCSKYKRVEFENFPTKNYFGDSGD